MFLVSSGFSLEKSGDLVWGSDSPVSEELSTCMEGSTTSHTGRKAIQQWRPLKHQNPLPPHLPHLLHHSIHSQHSRPFWYQTYLWSFQTITAIPCNHVQIWSEGQLEFCLLLSPLPDLQLQHLQHLCSSSHHFWLQELAERQQRNNPCHKQLVRRSKDPSILK